MSQGIKLFDQSLMDTLVKNKRYLLKRPNYLKAFTKIALNLKKQSKTRDKMMRKEELIVPPILIMSITNDCNLSCKGCYACIQEREKTHEMSIGQIQKTVDEAVELGTAIFLIAGGEPLVKKGILEVPKTHKDTLFVLFTNGLLIGEEVIEEVKSMKNLIPIISIEGDQETTDARRGEGIFSQVTGLMNKLNKNKILFGTSITLTSQNYDAVVKKEYLEQLEASGCAATFLIEYVPVDGDTDMCLTENQKQDLLNRQDELENMLDMIIVSLPGNEQKFEGCLASGRGFLHVSSTGSLEPCPFAPFSDTNVTKQTLKSALQSKLLRKIRDNHQELTESIGGCALNDNKKWIDSLMEDA
ncbi:MAG: radical SAM protein [Clostridiales bacterium]|nr:radical SAM protein [Clostridiales bacterium]